MSCDKEARTESLNCFRDHSKGQGLQALGVSSRSLDRQDDSQTVPEFQMVIESVQYSVGSSWVDHFLLCSQNQESSSLPPERGHAFYNGCFSILSFSRVSQLPPGSQMFLKGTLFDMGPCYISRLIWNFWPEATFLYHLAVITGVSHAHSLIKTLLSGITYTFFVAMESYTCQAPSILTVY